MIAAAIIAAALTADPAPPRVQALVIGASWCEPCKFQRKDCEKLIPCGLRVSEKEDAHIRFVDGDKELSYTVDWKIEVYPTTLILVEGKEVERFHGKVSALRIAGAMVRENDKLVGQK